jgi:hypothetical protein
MRVKLFMERQAGRRFPWREIENRPALVGLLQMHSVSYRSGWVTLLELRNPDNQTDAGRLAVLYEPVLLHIGNGLMRFRGYEHRQTEDGAVGLAQEWRCQIVNRQ